MPLSDDENGPRGRPIMVQITYTMYKPPGSISSSQAISEAPHGGSSVAASTQGSYPEDPPPEYTPYPSDSSVHIDPSSQSSSSLCPSSYNTSGSYNGTDSRPGSYQNVPWYRDYTQPSPQPPKQAPYTYTGSFGQHSPQYINPQNQYPYGPQQYSFNPQGAQPQQYFEQTMNAPQQPTTGPYPYSGPPTVYVPPESQQARQYNPPPRPTWDQHCLQCVTEPHHDGLHKDANGYSY